MKNAQRTLAAIIICASMLAGCDNLGIGDDSPAQPQTFSVTVTEVDIVRSADDQNMPVTGLPAQGAEITVSP